MPGGGIWPLGEMIAPLPANGPSEVSTTIHTTAGFACMMSADQSASCAVAVPTKPTTRAKTSPAKKITRKPFERIQTHLLTETNIALRQTADKPLILHTTCAEGTVQMYLPDGFRTRHNPFAGLVYGCFPLTGKHVVRSLGPHMRGDRRNGKR